MSKPTTEELYLFDLQGFFLLEGVLDDGPRQELLASVHDYERRDFEDAWKANPDSQSTLQGQWISSQWI